MPAVAAILVTGGAGYIGAHTVAALLAAGHRVSVLDDLSAGHRSFLPAGVPFHHVDLADAPATLAAVASAQPDAVVHFAGATEAGLSMSDPARFYRVNVVGSWHLAEALRATTGAPVVYSSSCAIYGDPQTVPVSETAPAQPASVYGRTKFDVEAMFAAYARAYGLRATALRYFNACGAVPGSGIGEDHPVETHLIPVAIAAARTRTPMRLFGTDYPTPDGTCVRDYIHVADLASAHLLALDALLAGAPGRPYNVGVGSGFSNRQVLAAVARATGAELDVRETGRRPGDPAQLYADPTLISTELGWSPAWTDLEAIVASAAGWYDELSARRGGLDHRAASHGPTSSAAASKKP